MASTTLTASYFTLTGAPPGEPPRHSLHARAAAARAAGFTGIALAPVELAIVRTAGKGAAQLREALADTGIAVPELEPLRGWDGEGEDAAAARRDEEAMYELAAAFGSERITAILTVGGEDPPETVARRFAAVCDRAAEHGLTVAFEPRAHSTVATPAEAAELLERSGRPNCGLIADCYHAHRAGWGGAELAAAGVPVVALHLNDTTATPLDPPLRDALENRLAPGEGDLDVAAWLRDLAEHRIAAPPAVEVLSATARELPLAEAASRAADGARAALAVAGEPTT